MKKIRIQNGYQPIEQTALPETNRLSISIERSVISIFYHGSTNFLILLFERTAQFFHNLYRA